MVHRDHGSVQGTLFSTNSADWEQKKSKYKRKVLVVACFQLTVVWLQLVQLSSLLL